MGNNNQAIVFYCTECSGIIMAMVNNTEHLKDSTREIANAIKHGYQTNIISNDEVRSSKWCDCEKED